MQIQQNFLNDRRFSQDHARCLGKFSEYGFNGAGWSPLQRNTPN